MILISPTQLNLVCGDKRGPQISDIIYKWREVKPHGEALLLIP